MTTDDALDYDACLIRLDDIFRPGGLLSQTIPSFEQRAEQHEMARCVLKSIAHGKPSVIEAGTGVGKSLAYLIPLAFAVEAGQTVVVSTHTINLQSQLMTKDIPIVQQLFPGVDLKPMLMKGRANFLCLIELDEASSNLLLEAEPSFGKLKRWASRTTDGDYAELTFPFPEWRQLTSTNESCRGKDCRLFNRCFYYRMREQAMRAKLLVVNHALYLTALAMSEESDSGAVLPAHQAVVFDEAHHLEEIAGKTLTAEVTNKDIPRLVDALHRMPEAGVDLTALNALTLESEGLFAALSLGQGEYRLPELGPAVDQALSLAGRLSAGLEKLSAQVASVAKEAPEESKDRLLTVVNQATQFRTGLDQILFQPKPGTVRWGESTQEMAGGRAAGQRVSLKSTPLDIAGTLAERLWPEAPGAVLTSATMASSAGFRFVRSQLGLPDTTTELQLGSPFNYAEHALLYVPSEMPRPQRENSDEYSEGAAQVIQRLVELVGGGTMALFTSRRMLDKVYLLLKDRLEHSLHKQGDLPPQKLVQEFRESGGVLFGVQTFWEGVDIPGEALRCVIIDRLPFPVPDAPILSARCAALEERGGNPFMELSIPMAQIRLKQGFGRLIRSHTDRGIVCILDTRLLNSAYGKEFVAALPPAARASMWNRVVRWWEISA